MKLRTIPAIVLTGVITFFSATGTPARPGNSGGDDQLKPMIQLKLQDMRGKPVRLGRLKGKIAVVDFWATWCGPCISEIPEFNALRREFAAKGVQVLGVAMASGKPSEIQRFATKHHMNYPVFIGNDDQTYDLNIAGYPTTYLVTSDWKVYKTYVGAGPEKHKELAADIEKLLSEKRQAAR